VPLIEPESISMTDQKEGHLGDLRVRRPGADWLDHAGRARLAEGLAVAVAASLPWSTTGTGILLAAWLVTLVSVIDPASVRREIMSPAGGLPVVLVVIAALGMAWSQASLGERLQGLEGFCKLLLIPLLLAQFRRSERGWSVVLWFFGASVALLLASSALASIPGLPWRGKMPGVPVKDYITQSGVFALCAFALLGCASEAWRLRRRQLAGVLIVVAAAFIADIAYVETGRTTLVTIAVLVPLFGFRQFGWRGIVMAGAGACVVAGVLWISSPHLRERVTHAVEEVHEYRAEHLPTSSGLRLDYWRKSLDIVSRAPVAGYGTGSIPMLLTPAGAPSTEAYFATVNPHNQILVVALQLGLIGTVVLLAMWVAHLALFRGSGLISWIGLVAVVQNMVGSLFNSHLSDFTQGWLYVFAVGILGGTALRQAAQQPAEGAMCGDAAIDPA
jgi:O-antigen ligase